MANSLTTINTNYKNYEEIATELDSNLDNVLEFNNMGDYTFIHCGLCGGPNIGHIATKCREFKNRYNDLAIKAMEDKIKGLEKFRKVLRIYKDKEKEKDSRDRVKEIEAVVGAIMEKHEKKTAETTQLVKARFPPTWIGQI